MSSPARRINGRPATAVCRHAPGCEVVARQDDLRAQIQTQSEAMVDALGLVVDKLNDLILRVADVSERQNKADQRETEWLRVLNEMSRKENANA